MPQILRDFFHLRGEYKGKSGEYPEHCWDTHRGNKQKIKRGLKRKGEVTRKLHKEQGNERVTGFKE
jgi:hypothetical protein